MTLSQLEIQLLSLIKHDARISISTLADALLLSQKETETLLKKLEKNQVIVNYSTILNPNKMEASSPIKALIELSVLPEKKSGYASFAKRINQHSHVTDLLLVSGQYDFLVTIEGQSLQEVSNCVSELASINGVSKTATHVVLNTYKTMGRTIEAATNTQRLPIIP